MNPELIYRRRRRKRLLQILGIFMTMMNVVIIMFSMSVLMGLAIQGVPQLECRGNLRKRHCRMANLDELVRESDVTRKNLLRMDRRTFRVLCEMVRDIKDLSNNEKMSLERMVAMFSYSLSHPNENQFGGDNYVLWRTRSGRKLFDRCLQGILKLYQHLLKKPVPITEDCGDERWKYFKNCLGALDCAFIDVHVPKEDRGRYCTRKGKISMNILGACTPSLEFTYILSGWEGSAEDNRVLRDAISRTHGLKVPQGCYYLADTKFTNYEGFLAPFTGHPYNLKAREDRKPTNAEEYLNKKHSEARNVINKCFSSMKRRWAILRKPVNCLPIRTQSRVFMACVLLHNLIRKYMPEEEEEEENEYSYEDDEFIGEAGSSDTRAGFRDT